MNFQPPEDPAHDEFVREQQAEAHWQQQLTDAYAEGRKDEREELTRLLAWAYSKLHLHSFSRLDDALALDEIKLILMGQQ